MSKTNSLKDRRVAFFSITKRCCIKICRGGVEQSRINGVKHMTSRYAGSAARVIKAATRRGGPSKAALSLTHEAVERVKYLLSKHPEMKALKVSFIP